MDLIPAVDLLGGEAVRLVQGDYARRAGTNADPAASVRAWAAAGVRWLHVVDLDGARSGMPTHLDLARELAAAGRQAAPGLRVQLGGGLRTADAVARVLDGGVDVAILSTAALTDAALIDQLAGRWPGRIAVSLDVKGDAVAVDGWVRAIAGDPATLAADLVRRGIRTLIVTDVQRDGTRRGPNLDLLDRIRGEAPDVRLLAAGGIASAEQVRALAEAGLDGAIVGLALLDGSLPLHDALAAAATTPVRA
jgi:phosphoribosylformimino-5-aminoimidazole carboxamide ribotide isomerase